MRLIRYVNKGGDVRYGREGPPGEAFPLVGEVFGEHRFAESAEGGEGGGRSRELRAER